MLSATALRVSRRYGQEESFDCYGGLSRFRSLLKKPPFILREPQDERRSG